MFFIWQFHESKQYIRVTEAPLTWENFNTALLKGLEGEMLKILM